MVVSSHLFIAPSITQYNHLFGNILNIPKILFIYFLREKKGGRKRGRETWLIDAPSLHQLVLFFRLQPLYLHIKHRSCSHVFSLQILLFFSIFVESFPSTYQQAIIISFTSKMHSRPVWCGSVAWASSCKANSSWLISAQGTCVICRSGPQSGACKRQPNDASLPYWCFSLALSLSLPFHPFLNEKKMSSGEDKSKDTSNK